MVLFLSLSTANIFVYAKLNDFGDFSRQASEKFAASAHDLPSLFPENGFHDLAIDNMNGLLLAHNGEPMIPAQRGQQPYSFLDDKSLFGAPPLPKEDGAWEALPLRPEATSMLTLAEPADAAAENGFIKTGLTASLKQVDIAMGKAQVVNLNKPASRISISKPDVASVVILSPTQIQLVGNAIGIASLLVWQGSDDEYSVIDINVHRDMSVLQRQLNEVDPRIKATPMAVDDSLVLSGRVNSTEQERLALEITKTYFQNVSSSGGGLASTTNAGIPNIVNLLNIDQPGDKRPPSKAAWVRQKLKSIDDGIHMDVIPGADGSEKVILTGKVKTPSSVSRAINTVSIFYGKPGLKVLTGPGGNRVRDNGSGQFQTAEAFNTNMDSNILQGSIITDETGNVVSMLEVAYRPQIQARVKILDVNRVALKQLGHNFMSNFNDVSVGSFSGSQAPAAGKTISTFDPQDSGALVTETSTGVGRSGAVNFASGINPIFGSGITQFITLNQKYALALSALVERRQARSLAEPTITMLSGEKSSFLAGGEVPIPVIGTNGQISIEYHEFGIRLNLVATLNDEGKIHLQVAPEISSLDAANSITTAQVSVPAFSTRRFQTTIELDPGQSFVMAGLFNQEDTDSVSKFPGLGSVPIIGSFFRNKFTDRRDREMVVVIQPEVIMVPNSGTKAAFAP